MLYINNYVDYSRCMPQAWYISTDMQLSIIGMAIFCLLQSARARKVAIAIVFVVGLLTPAVHTFFQDLNAVLIISPEFVRQFFFEDPTFHNLHKRGHTNVVCYAMGLALGMLMYDKYGQEDTKNTKNWRLLYWAATPIGLVFITLGVMFYADDFEVPLYVRAVYSGAIKMCIGACVCVIIAGSLMKLDSVVRGILEWQGWAPMSRISYCAYLIHVCVMRASMMNINTLQQITVYHLTLNFCAFAGVTYVLSVPCWLLVESPVAQFVKVCLEGPSRNKSEEAVKDAPSKWKDQELSSSAETVVVKT